MKNRAYKRIPANLTVNFHYDNTIYSGTIINFSDNDMFIKMDMPCQLSSTQKQFEVRISVKDKILLAIARIKRMEITGKQFKGIGVELEYPIGLDKLINN